MLKNAIIHWAHGNMSSGCVKYFSITVSKLCAVAIHNRILLLLSGLCYIPIPSLFDPTSEINFFIQPTFAQIKKKEKKSSFFFFFFVSLCPDINPFCTLWPSFSLKCCQLEIPYSDDGSRYYQRTRGYLVVHNFQTLRDSAFKKIYYEFVWWYTFKINGLG